MQTMDTYEKTKSSSCILCVLNVIHVNELIKALCKNAEKCN